MANNTTLFYYFNVFQSYGKDLFQTEFEIISVFFLKINFALYCLTGRAFRRECRKLLGDLWRLKDVHISCIINPKPDKHYHYHQQMTLTNRTRIILPQKYQQEQRIKRSYL